MPSGSYTDDGGVARCRATGKRCLSHRQAAELAHKAHHRGEKVSRYHCGLCAWWHVGHDAAVMGKPSRQPRRPAAWKARQPRRTG